MSLTLQGALESGQKGRIEQFDFSVAFESVNYLRIINELCSVGIGGSVLSVLARHPSI